MNSLHELRMLIHCAKEAYDFSDKVYELFGTDMSLPRASEIYYAYESLVFKMVLNEREVPVELTDDEMECFTDIIHELATENFQSDSFIKTPEELLHHFLNITEEWANMIGLSEEKDFN